MLTEAQKKRLVELQAKSDRTEAETKEFGELVALAAGNTEVVEESLVLDAEAEESLATKIAEKMLAAQEAGEGTKRKNLGAGAGKGKGVGDGDGSGDGSGDDDSEVAKKSKEARLVLGIKALMNKDFATLKAVNDANLSEMDVHQKAPFQNENTNADGGYLVPPADFIADVARLEEQYGVAIKDARIYRVNGNTVLLNKKASGVTMFEMTLGQGHGEGQVKTGTKMTFGQDSVTLRKFAAIAAVTDELLEDSAVNIYNELTTDFARETARWQDRLVFTDASSGIVNQSGVVAITSGTLLDQMVQATWQVPTQSARGGKFYISRSRFGGLLQAKDSQQRYILSPGADGSSGTTVWGYPYQVVEVLEEFGQRNTVIFGNLQYVVLVLKNGLQLKTLTEGTIHDADGNAVNLAEQDMTGLRAVTRMAARVQFPKAFAVLTGGTVS